MRNILDKIILEKKKHIHQLKEIIDIKSLEQSEYFEIETYSLKNRIIKENNFDNYVIDYKISNSIKI